MPQHLNSNGETAMVTPMLCRLRNLSYLSSLTAHLTLTRETYIDGEVGQTREMSFGKMEICQLPVMLGSRLCYTHNTNDAEKVYIDECTTDKGGYFIIQGGEKVIVGQERAIDNFLQVIKTDLVS
jgi:DNA-directed RNA polymerase II subunit RPB2